MEIGFLMNFYISVNIFSRKMNQYQLKGDQRTVQVLKSLLTTCFRLECMHLRVHTQHLLNIKSNPLISQLLFLILSNGIIFIP